jgi:hypothetical protein
MTKEMAQPCKNLFINVSRRKYILITLLEDVTLDVQEKMGTKINLVSERVMTQSLYWQKKTTFTEQID